jgi:eukaryotic-like serine/threonine-protein kinase
MTERELFEAAVDAAPDDRAAFLDVVCAGAPELRKRVEALLARQEQAGSFLEGDALERAALEGLPVGTDRAKSASPLADAAGQVLAGRYKLLQQIGEGGMGTVWLAMQTEPVHRRVAIKLIKAGMDSRMVLSRFEAERQALALMDHPNIAKVLDGGSTDQGRPFFVMEYVKGVPITEYCDDAHLTVAERLELFIPVCQAVQHAHQKGVIHRDLKPSNLLICLYDDKPVPKVIDFGLAKAMNQPLTERTLFTAHGLMLGTPLYMSPEQVAVNNLDVDTRTDIYSLGVVLYELLTGTTPLEKEQLKQASWPEVLRLIKEIEPPKPSTRVSQGRTATSHGAGTSGRQPGRTGMSEAGSRPLLRATRQQELDWIVMKALDKDRSRRYVTANGLARDLERYLHDEPVEASPPSAWYRLRKLARRNRAMLTTAALVLLTLVLGTAVSVWQALLATEAMNSERDSLIHLEQANQVARGQTQEAKKALAQLGVEFKRTKEAEEKATRELFDALVAQARANRLSRRIGQRFGTFEILGKAITIARQLKLPAERFLELRNEALAAMALPDLRVAKEWSDTPGTNLVFDHQLQRYARADAKGTVSIRRVGDGAEICRLPGPGGSYPEFSPDGRLLALFGARVQVWRLAGKEPAKVLDEAWRPWGLAFSPDSRQVVFQLQDRSIAVFDLATSEKVERLPPVDGAECLTFNPKVRQLAFISYGAVQVQDLQTGEVLWKQPFHGSHPWLGWHPDGKTLAVGESTSGGDLISLWDVAAGTQIGKLEGMQGAGIRFAFNHAGTLLASTGWEGILRLWDPLTSRELFSIFDSGTFTPRFGPDDRFLAAADYGSRLRIWEIAAGDAYRTLTANPVAGARRYVCSDTSADGLLLAAGAENGVGVWDLQSGKNLAFIEGMQGLNLVLLEPSGALLTMGINGLFRRPLRREQATGMLYLAEPEKLPVPGVGNQFAQTADGKVLASAQFQGAVVLHADEPQRLIRLGPHTDVRFVAVSPNGQWVATGRFGYPGGAKVWDARTGKLQVDLPVGSYCRVVFSPDGKRLLTDAGGASPHSGQIRVWEVGTWAEVQLKVTVRGTVPAFSPDGKLLAVETGEGIARLLDPNTGAEYARLEDPSKHRAYHLSFSPDSTQLVSATCDGHCLHIWDVRTLRRRLAEMGLDWE